MPKEKQAKESSPQRAGAPYERPGLQRSGSKTWPSDGGGDSTLLLPASSHTDGRSPCAACKLLRRKCTEECMFADHFPQKDMERFLSLHRCYGAANIIKLLSGIPKDLRGDAIKSLAYEAQARMADPVYGCVGAVALLQKEIDKLTAELRQERANLAGFTQLHSRMVSKSFLTRRQSLPSLQLARRANSPPAEAANSMMSTAPASAPPHMPPRAARAVDPRQAQELLETLLAELTQSLGPSSNAGSTGVNETLLAALSSLNNSEQKAAFNPRATVYDPHPFNFEKMVDTIQLDHQRPTMGAASDYQGVDLEALVSQAGTSSGEGFKFESMDTGFGSPLGPLEYGLFQQRDNNAGAFTSTAPAPTFLHAPRGSSFSSP